MLLRAAAASALALAALSAPFVTDAVIARGGLPGQAAPAPAAGAPAADVDADWRTIPDDEILVFTLRGGRQVVIRLAPRFAPAHIANIRKFADARWWDGTSVYRVQDNYVAQWGDATERKPLPPMVIANPPAEYETRGIVASNPLTRPDPYAARVGYTADGWAVAGDGNASWLPHCYGMVGVARDMAPSTGSGAELYTVIGHSPRHLDRNIAVVGRVIEGVQWLSSLPRGTGAMGVYETPGERTPILSARLASQLPEDERPHFQVRATDTPAFLSWLRERENRKPPFFTVPAGGTDICNALPPVRRMPS